MSDRNPAEDFFLALGHSPGHVKRRVGAMVADRSLTTGETVPDRYFESIDPARFNAAPAEPAQRRAPMPSATSGFAGAPTNLIPEPYKPRTRPGGLAGLGGMPDPEPAPEAAPAPSTGDDWLMAAGMSLMSSPRNNPFAGMPSAMMGLSDRRERAEDRAFKRAEYEAAKASEAADKRSAAERAVETYQWAEKVDPEAAEMARVAGYGSKDVIELVQQRRKAAAEGAKVPIDEESSLRKEYLGLQATKDYEQTLAAFEKVQTAAKTDSGPGDISLIFGYMKMLDPGSVVREGEFATAENAGGAGERLRNLYNRAVEGERLSPDMRNKFVQSAGDIYNSVALRQQKRAEQYTTLAEDYGLNPGRIVGEIPTFEAEDLAPAPASSPPPPETGAVVDGWTFKGGDPSDPKNWAEVT